MPLSAGCRCPRMPARGAVWQHGAVRKAGKEVWIQNTRSCGEGGTGIRRFPSACGFGCRCRCSVSREVPLPRGLRVAVPGAGWLRHHWVAELSAAGTPEIKVLVALFLLAWRYWHQQEFSSLAAYIIFS